jgi:hypothetical protein
MWQYCTGSAEKNPTARRTGSRCCCPRRRDCFRRWPGKGNGSGSGHHRWQRRGAAQPPRRRAVGSGGRAAFPQAFLNGCGRGACGARSTWSPGRPPWSTATSCRPYAGTGQALDPASCRSTIHTQLHKHEEIIRCHYPGKHHLCVFFRSVSLGKAVSNWIGIPYTTQDTTAAGARWSCLFLAIDRNGYLGSCCCGIYWLARSLATTPFTY